MGERETELKPSSNCWVLVPGGAQHSDTEVSQCGSTTLVPVKASFSLIMTKIKGAANQDTQKENPSVACSTAREQGKGLLLHTHLFRVTLPLDTAV